MRDKMTFDIIPGSSALIRLICIPGPRLLQNGTNTNLIVRCCLDSKQPEVTYQCSLYKVNYETGLLSWTYYRSPEILACLQFSQQLLPHNGHTHNTLEAFVYLTSSYRTRCSQIDPASWIFMTCSWPITDSEARWLVFLLPCARV
jgi:hypothetical protein